MTDIYAAGEEPIPGVTVDALADAITAATSVPVEVVRRLEDVPSAVARTAVRGDVVITLGAGSVGTLPDQLVAALGRAS